MRARAMIAVHTLCVNACQASSMQADCEHTPGVEPWTLNVNAAPVEAQQLGPDMLQERMLYHLGDVKPHELHGANVAKVLARFAHLEGNRPKFSAKSAKGTKRRTRAAQVEHRLVPCEIHPDPVRHRGKGRIRANVELTPPAVCGLSLWIPPAGRGGGRQSLPPATAARCCALCRCPLP